MGNNLYVRNLSQSTTEASLRAFFEKIGVVEKIDLIYDPHTKESRGFAFITMQSAADADRAINEFNRSNLDGRIIAIERARRTRPHDPTPGRYYGERNRRPDQYWGPRGQPPSASYYGRPRDDRYPAYPAPYRESRGPPMAPPGPPYGGPPPPPPPAAPYALPAYSGPAAYGRDYYDRERGPGRGDDGRDYDRDYRRYDDRYRPRDYDYRDRPRDYDYYERERDRR